MQQEQERGYFWILSLKIFLVFVFKFFLVFLGGFFLQQAAEQQRSSRGVAEEQQRSSRGAAGVDEAK